MPAPRPAVIGQRPIASKARELSKKKSQLRRPSGSRSKLDDHAGALFHFEVAAIEHFSGPPDGVRI
jgi:hypothetical protein